MLTGIKNRLKAAGLLSALSLMALSSTSCNSDAPSVSPLAIFVTPGAKEYVEISSGEKVKYDIEISTTNEYIANLTVESFDRQYGAKQLLNIEIKQQSYITSFVFTAPELNTETGEVTLTFTVTDNQGNTAQANRKITVLNRIVTVPEITGIILYSPFTGMPDALSLKDVTRPFSLDASPDPESADIYLVCDESFSSVGWRSNTKTKFIRNNSFNYAGAAASTIQSVYEGSVRYDLIDNLQINDIILVGHGETAQGVFLVTNLQKGVTGLDFMMLSYKGVGFDLPEPEQPTPPQEEPNQSAK